jgi:hypothetical protein
MVRSGWCYGNQHSTPLSIIDNEPIDEFSELYASTPNQKTLLSIIDKSDIR